MASEFENFPLPSLIKDDLALAVAQKHRMRLPDARKVVNAFLGAVLEALESGQRVVLRDFGTLTPKTRAARAFRIPSTDRKVLTPATSDVAFRPARSLRAALEGRHA